MTRNTSAEQDTCADFGSESSRILMSFLMKDEQDACSGLGQ